MEEVYRILVGRRKGGGDTIGYQDVAVMQSAALSCSPFEL
jgi:hypothetical protein